MHIVAITALYLSFQDRMTRQFTDLGFRISMAAKADGQLIGFLIAGMYSVTGDTGNIVSLVLPDIPVGHVTLLGMALQTDAAQLIGGVPCLFTESENVDTSTAALFHMRRSCPVTGLAGILRLRSLY